MISIGSLLMITKQDETFKIFLWLFIEPSVDGPTHAQLKKSSSQNNHLRVESWIQCELRPLKLSIVWQWLALQGQPSTVPVIRIAQKIYSENKQPKPPIRTITLLLSEHQLILQTPFGQWYSFSLDRSNKISVYRIE